MNHLLLCAEDSEAELRAEARRSLPGAQLRPVKPLLFCADFELPQGMPMPFLPHARQFFPNAVSVRADSIRAWSEEMARAIMTQIPEDRPWVLHIEPHYGVRQVHRVGARAWHSMSRTHTQPRPADPGPGIDPGAGKNRCALIRTALLELLRKKRRHLLKNLRGEAAPFTCDESLVQACLTAPDSGFISVAPAPLPYEQRHLVSFLPMGRVEVASDKAAPSRAFAKLVESEIRLGRRIQTGETCVDLGAAPGSWTYVAAARGARVLAVDRSPLREDLMRHRSVEFVAHDAFTFKPPRPVDWLLCDVIAEPERSAELLTEWLRNRWTNAFVVTLKLKDSPESVEMLDRVAARLRDLVSELRISRLCANKKEVCAFGCRERIG